MTVSMLDAAHYGEVPPSAWEGVAVAAGYLPSRSALHPWTAADWAAAAGHAPQGLPIWVASDLTQGAAEGAQAAASLRALGVPAGAIVALDLETNTAEQPGASAYTSAFAAAAGDHGGYITMVYSSLAGFGRLSWSGFRWLAYPGAAEVPPGYEACQWAYRGTYDLSVMAPGLPLWTFTKESNLMSDNPAPELVARPASGTQVAAAIVHPNGTGYLLVTPAGKVWPFGGAESHGQVTVALNEPIIDAGYTNSGNGYWLFAADGGVFAFGDAAFFGSLPGEE